MASASTSSRARRWAWWANRLRQDDRRPHDPAADSRDGREVRYKGEDFYAYQGKQLRQIRRQMQIVFQDPVSSLNPRMTIGNIIGEPIEVHGIAKGAREERAGRGLARARGAGSDVIRAAIRTNSPAGSGSASASPGPWRLSPDFIVCDEPVSALDVSIQSQILNLLDDLQKERNIAYLFIAHNLAVVEHFSDEVAVMYLGRIVEKAASRGAVSQSQASLHDGAAVGGARAQPAAEEAADRAAGRSALPLQSADGLPVSSALSADAAEGRGGRRIGNNSDFGGGESCASDVQMRGRESPSRAKTGGCGPYGGMLVHGVRFSRLVRLQGGTGPRRTA